MEGKIARKCFESTVRVLGRSKVPDADATHFFMSRVLLEPVLGFCFEEFQFLENPQRKEKRA